MNILAFDTSTEKFSISILKNNKIVLNLSKILNKTYSKFLVSILKKSLEKSNLDIKKINCILISLGPGSFTGIRIGIAAAKGLGIPHKICISGYNNMYVLVNSVDKDIKKQIITIIKSKKNDYYFQVFSTKKKPLTKTSFFSINNLPKFFFKKNVVFSGDLDLDLIKEIKKKKIKFFFYKKKFSNARMLINLVKEKHYIKKNTSLDPIYVYNHYASKN